MLISHRLRALARLPLLLLLLVGCADFNAMPRLTEPVAVRPEAALLRLPDELAQRRIATTRRIDNGREIERVVLANDTALPFENRVEVRTMWRGQASLPFARDLPRGQFTDSAIRQTAAREFPDAELSEPVAASNRNGPYAYVRAELPDAVGCIYAWQVVDGYAALDRSRHQFALELRDCAVKADPTRMLAAFDAISLQAQR
jgi:hypothetical protein